MIVSFFIPLPWSAVVSAKVIYVVVIDFLADFFDLFTEEFLVTVENISAADFVSCSS